MARIVIATLPATGHVTPLLPIARALAARGHDVRWLSGTKHEERIGATGARFVPYVDTPMIDETRLDEHFPGRAGLTGFAALKFDIKHVFLGFTLTMLQDLDALHAQEPMDLLIADIGFVGAQLFHERTHVPFVALNVLPLSLTSRDVAPFGLALPPSSSRLGRLRNRALYALVQDGLLREARDYYRSLRAQAGLGARGWFMDVHERASVVLHPSIPSLEYPRSDLPDNVHFIGMLPPEPAPSLAPPAWLSQLDGACVVHVTQGTIANQRPRLLGPTLEALAREPLLVVATSGGRPLAELALGELPRNARVAPFVPHALLLPKTDLMITNGGYGGVQMALSHGVPLVVAGDTEDKPEVAARVAYAGAGLNLRSGQPSVRALRRAVRSALEDERLRARARALRDEYAHYDALALALGHVDSLLGLRTNSPRPRARHDLTS